jgi:cis-L-3-hydroxyproline dehydratase
VFLSDEEKRMLNGECGPGVQKSMEIMVKYGDALYADKMVKAVSAHVPSESFELLFTEMTEGATAPIIVTTHARGGDPRLAMKYSLIEKEKGQQILEQHLNSTSFIRRRGFIPSYTCAPYLIGNVLKFGDVASWCGTGGAVISNSWFGARLNRDGVTLSLACAVTGRLPYVGRLLTENRRGQLLVELDNLDLLRFTEAEYGAMGYYIGGIANERNVAINGLPSHITLNMAKYLLSPLPVSGAVCLCHIVGVTPEAPTVEAALGNSKPEEILVVGKRELKEAWDSLNTATGDNVDIVILGCPHLSIMEIKQLAALLEGKKVHKNVKLVIGASRMIYSLAKEAGFINPIEEAGGIFDDSCIGSHNPFLTFDNKSYTGATNSARTAHYTVRIAKTKMFYGTTQSCLDAAITGIWRGQWGRK